MDSKKKLEELIWEMPDKLRAMGLSISTISEYMRGYSWVLNYHRERGAEYFDRSVITEYVERVEERSERKEISKMLYRNYLRAAEQLAEYCSCRFKMAEVFMEVGGELLSYCVVRSS